ncbi:hypothetical protein [Leeuwenhoekiella sp. MAR_2009_132]|uniref:hypothetical protein n=1 Tax=Leeuwenhoekiella sp. MAR_2009_132 TaxID=1392489 RepID=UPI000491EC73|nr:hypothetical protein [Leeuwenhoekiella sp. MAR_2009_132]
MENTLENKAAFFAQYWGQEVAFIPDYDQGVTLIKSGVRKPKEIKYLELTQLSNIIDEDYKIAQKLDGNFGTSALDYSLQFINHSNLDFLHSKGYALPFRGIDVETLISWGWVKLKK